MSLLRGPRLLLWSWRVPASAPRSETLAPHPVGAVGIGLWQNPLGISVRDDASSEQLVTTLLPVRPETGLGPDCPGGGF